jgi:hypothetical protein
MLGIPRVLAVLVSSQITRELLLCFVARVVMTGQVAICRVAKQLCSEPNVFVFL